MAIFLTDVTLLARHVMNAEFLFLEIVTKAIVEMGMVLMKMVLVMVGMLEFMSMPFNKWRVILKTERLDLVDLPTGFSIWPWSLHFSLPKLYL